MTILRFHHVKLNNPLMGTETSQGIITRDVSLSVVKLNNPLMGTETQQRRDTHQYQCIGLN